MARGRRYELWMAAPDSIGPMILAFLYLSVVCIAIPYLAWSSYRHLSSEGQIGEKAPTPRLLATQALVVHGVVLGLATACAATEQLEITWFSIPERGSLIAAVVVVATFISIARLEAKRPLASHEVLRRQLRRSGLSKIWLVTMVVAAVAEEYAYRGVLYLLFENFMAPTIAAGLAAVVFGLGHLSQGPRGATLSAVFAAAMQFLFLASGALLLPITCHLLYDLAASWMGRKRAPGGRLRTGAQQADVAERSYR